MKLICVLFIFHTIFSPWIRMWRFAFTSGHQKGIQCYVFTSIWCSEHMYRTTYPILFFVSMSTVNPWRMRVRVQLSDMLQAVIFGARRKCNRWRQWWQCRVSDCDWLNKRYEKTKAFISLFSLFCFHCTTSHLRLRRLSWILCRHRGCRLLFGCGTDQSLLDTANI